jgi:hypothetical protein
MRRVRRIGPRLDCAGAPTGETTAAGFLSSHKHLHPVPAYFIYRRSFGFFALLSMQTRSAGELLLSVRACHFAGRSRPTNSLSPR